MSNYQYQFTRLALSDMEQALSYIKEMLCNPIAAQNLVLDIDDAIRKACNFPYAYPDCSVYLVQDLNVRHINVKNYVMIYEIDPAHETLHILRFLYSKMDFTDIPIQ